MYNVLVKLILLAALIELGMNVSEFENCRSQQCLQQIEKRSRDVLKVDWKPVSVFPKEAVRFR